MNVARLAQGYNAKPVFLRVSKVVVILHRLSVAVFAFFGFNFRKNAAGNSVVYFVSSLIFIGIFQSGGPHALYAKGFSIFNYFRGVFSSAFGGDCSDLLCIPFRPAYRSRGTCGFISTIIISVRLFPFFSIIFNVLLAHNGVT